MKKAVVIASLFLFAVSVWNAFWMMRGQAVLARSPADVHAKQRDAVLEDARQMDQAAELIVPVLPMARRSADALRRQSGVIEAAAQLLLVDDLLAKHDPLALAQARILVSQTERLAGAGSPALTTAKALLAQAYVQQPAEAMPRLPLNSTPAR